MSKVEFARHEFDNAPRIARMTEHDLLEVVEIEEMCGLSRWGWSGYHAELLNGAGHLLLVARVDRDGRSSIIDDRLAGFIASRLVADELHVNNIAVRPAYRRSGLGGALLYAVMREGLRLGAQSAVLEVRASNHAAQSLYERYGFRLAGRRKGYYSEPPEDALVMRATLTGFELD